MSKGKGRGPRIPGGGNPAGMMQQLQRMQQDMIQAQEDLANEVLNVSVGGGAVTVEITGHQRIVSIKVSPEVLSSGDVDMLNDLLLAAVNEAIVSSQNRAKERMEAITGGVDIPGLGGGW
jgi:DNA-binding YbaB/EbfC family protein